MSPGIQLILGSLMLSAVITYAWWTSLRVLFLQRDLVEIRADLRSSVDSEGGTDDEQVREFADTLDRLIAAAPSLSPAVIGPMAKLSGGDLRGCLGPDAEPFFRLLLDRQPRRPELLGALWRVEFRLARYLALETFSGWCSIAGAAILGVDDVVGPSADRSSETRDSMEVRALAILLSRGHYRLTA